MAVREMVGETLIVRPDLCALWNWFCHNAAVSQTLSFTLPLNVVFHFHVIKWFS